MYVLVLLYKILIILLYMTTVVQNKIFVRRLRRVLSLIHVETSSPVEYNFGESIRLLVGRVPFTKDYWLDENILSSFVNDQTLTDEQ